MDLRAENDRAAGELEWGEFASILIYDLLAETANPPPPTTTPPPPVPAELELNANPQPPMGQGGAHGGYIPLGTDSYMMAPPIINQAPLRPEDVLQPSQLYSQADSYRQGQDLEWKEFFSNLEAAIYDSLGETPNPPLPPTTPPPPVPAELELNADAQPPMGQGGAHGGYIPVGTDPYMMAPPIINQAPLHPEDVLQPSQLYSQADAYSQGQYLLYQWPVDDNVTAAAVGDPTAPSYLYGDSPVFILPRDVDQNLCPVSVVNGQLVCEMPEEILAPDSVVPPVDTSNSKKRKHYTQSDDYGPYIKKPPNAFY